MERRRKDEMRKGKWQNRGGGGKHEEGKGVLKKGQGEGIDKGQWVRGDWDERSGGLGEEKMARGR